MTFREPEDLEFLVEEGVVKKEYSEDGTPIYSEKNGDSFKPNKESVPERKTNRWVSLIAVVLFLAFVFGIVFYQSKQNQLGIAYVKVIDTRESIRHKKGPDSETYYITIEYTDKNGNVQSGEVRATQYAYEYAEKGKVQFYIAYIDPETNTVQLLEEPYSMMTYDLTD